MPSPLERTDNKGCNAALLWVPLFTAGVAIIGKKVSLLAGASITSICICAVLLALVSTFCAFVNVHTPGLLPQFVTISAGASVRSQIVFADLLAATIKITRALVDVLTTFSCRVKLISRFT